MISFIIPARNESKYIARTLSSIISHVAQSTEYEIIVVDNNSIDDTANIVSSFSNVKLVRLDQQVTIASARNKGVSYSSGEILVFLDGDMLITQSWAEALLSFKKDIDNNANLISGCRVSISKDPSWIEKTWFSSMKVSPNPSYINSGNLLTSKKIFDKISGFDTKLTTGEDVDFCMRARVSGAQIVSNAAFYAHHEGYPKTLKNFFKREQWHGIGDVESLEKFIHSKVAIFSWGIYVLLIAALVSALNHSWFYFLGFFGCFVVLNFLAVRSRFIARNLYHYASLFFLHLVYAFARCTSIYARKVNRQR